MQHVLLIQSFSVASLHQHDTLHIHPHTALLVYFYVDLQVSTGSQPPSGWYHSNQTSALDPGVGVPLMA